MMTILATIIQYAFAGALVAGIVALSAVGIYASCMAIYYLGAAIMESAGGRK